MNSDDQLAHHLATIRQQHQFTLEQLEKLSGVSKATLSRIEKAQTSPTATVLNQLCSVYGLTMSQMLFAAEAQKTALLKSNEMTTWMDPASGYTRKLVSPPAKGFAIELLEINLPENTCVAYDQPSIRGLEHHLYMLAGHLVVTLNKQRYELQKGDSMRFKTYHGDQFCNPRDAVCTYILAIGNS